MTPGPGGEPAAGPAGGAGRVGPADVEAVFGALAHATRRHVLEVLAASRGAMTAGELSAHFAHSWPTTTRHLTVLVDAGLVSVTPVGRERHYRLERPRLGAVLAHWLAPLALTLTDETPPSAP